MHKPTRQEAIRKGLIHYWGSPCRHGHKHGKRFTINGRCVECQARTVEQDREEIREFKQLAAAVNS